MSTNASIDFFDTQFQQQIARHDFALNPFELAALPYLRGRILDFGCGMGNLAVHAARAGHAVLALDASACAIAHLRALASQESLMLEASQADLRAMQLQDSFDTVISIGLLMFFDCASAHRQLAHLKSLVRPGGVIVLNVLTEGTTFMDMFVPESHCLFGATALPDHFDGWRVLMHEHSTYAAAGGKVKAFATFIAERGAPPTPGSRDTTHTR